MAAVRRFALGFIVALLTLSASGVSSLMTVEPCTAYEEAGREDGGCPPTCVTCGCCAQSAEPAFMIGASSPDLPVAGIVSVRPRLVKTDPHGILHVPKSFLL
jgi:hypothetical protein